MLVNFLMGMLMTFTVYNPANNSLTQVVNSILAPNSGIVVVPNSIRLKYGSGYGETSTNLQSSVSFYNGSIAALGIGPGLLLTSGDGNPALSNTSSGYSVELTPSETDASLTQAVQTAFKFAGEVQDASTLEFQFTVNNPALTGIRFDLVFGSDEFPEFVDSSYVDIAGVFVNGVNYALFNGNSNQPLSVIGTNLAQGGFQDNTSGALPVEYDGIMRLVSVVVPVQQGVNTIKIGVADTGDQILDSGLFVSNVRAVPYASGGLLTVVNGTGGNDVLTGLGFNELLDGGVGNDKIRGNGGNDLIIGGAGKDISAYSAVLSNYTVTKTPAGYTVTDKTGTDGIDTLSGIEALSFSDKSINLQIQAQAAAAPTADVTRLIELYVAFFNRTPDADGLSYWIGQKTGGLSVNQIAESFYSAGVQFSSLTGFSSTMGNAAFVNVVYKNVLGRPDGADAQGLAYWSGKLADQSETRGTLVSTILDSAHTYKGDASFGYVADLLDNKITVAKTVAIDYGLNYNSADVAVSNGMAIAAAVTPGSIAAAIALVGVNGLDLQLV